MSVHALSRLPRLNKPGLPEVSEEMLIKIIKGTPNYTEGEDKQIYFIHELQLLVVRNKKNWRYRICCKKKGSKGGMEKCLRR